MRKRHLQVEIDFHRRGGRRKGAGRKRRSPRRRVSHTSRPAVCPRNPHHITLRVVDDMPRLRRRDAFRAVRHAMLVSLRRQDFRIVHLSIQGNHLHLVCEAEHRAALSSGMQGFKISAAKQLNKIHGREGFVFADRYHEEVLTSPAQVRNCLAYVLNNWRRHGEDRGCGWIVDPYSTGVWFGGWREAPQLRVPDGALPRVAPRTWLLAAGWKKARPISCYEVPGRGAPARRT